MASEEKNRYPLIQVDCPVDCDFNSNFTATYGIELGLYQNTLIRCLNSIYYNSVRVKPGDEAAFAGYGLSLIASIRGHQSEGLGKIWLPFVQAKYDTTSHVEYHAHCDKILKPLEEYLKKVSSGEQAYDGQKVRELIESFGDYLVKVFHVEMPALDKSVLEQFEKKDVDATANKHRQFLEQNPHSISNCLLVISHHDFASTPAWPPQQSSDATKAITDSETYKKTASFWKFAPNGLDGKPQTYA